MSYVEQVLGADESVVLKAKVSIFAFIGDLFAILVLAILSIAIHPFIAIFIIFLLLRMFVIITTTELALTNRKVIAKFGFIRRDTIELRLEKIESIRVGQGILGRIFNFGTIFINGAGSSAPVPFIGEPIKFKKSVDEYIENKLSK
ncbi:MULTISPECIES: PH domain-containing protein [unclassified Campylobacter]|uniref:PH domain-containing protein n=1 Tax=unclassified Campylobacter TaxID=2593542 RepID=UPI001DD89598|nr:PH domain-containing protein [Campylobacter sp. RM9331]MBZ8005528.1 PH domain-containing protein [Campylobacter sp. RM9332]